MPSLADLICEEMKSLGEPQAREVLDFVCYLKYKTTRTQTSEAQTEAAGADDDWAEFEKLAGAWSGKFNRHPPATDLAEDWR